MTKLYLQWMKNEPKELFFHIRTQQEMRDYIALNWLEPEEAKLYNIPNNTIIVREDWWKNKAKHLRILVHEQTEIFLRLKFGFNYEQAHHLATLAEHQAIKNKGWKLDGKIKHR